MKKCNNPEIENKSNNSNNKIKTNPTLTKIPIRMRLFEVLSVGFDKVTSVTPSCCVGVEAGLLFWQSVNIRV